LTAVAGAAGDSAARPSPTVEILSDAGAPLKNTFLEKARLSKISAAIFFKDASVRVLNGLRVRLKGTFALHLHHYINILSGGRDSVEPSEQKNHIFPRKRICEILKR
jgi:hypothetical protein